MGSTTVTLTLGEFQAIALTRALRGLRAIARQAEVVSGEVTFEKREPSPLLTMAGPREIADEIDASRGTDGCDAAPDAHPAMVAADPDQP